MLTSAPIVDGYLARGFAVVRDAFKANCDRRLDVGAQFAVSHGSQLVVDLSGGYADDEVRCP